MFVNDDIYYFFIGYDRKRKAERMRLPDDMFCKTCKSTLLRHFFRNSCFTKKKKSLSFTTHLASVGFLLIIETLIIILATKRSVVKNGCYEKGDIPKLCFSNML